MKIFVCEYATGGGLAGQWLASSLAREGELMVRALARDLAEVAGVELVLARDARLPPLGLAAETVWIEDSDESWATWAAVTARVDALWPIAPETGGVLERLSRLAPAHGRLLLGSRPEAVALTASKRATSDRLAHHGVAVVPTWRAAQAPLARARNWVVKPDDGVGCLGARRYRREALRAALAQGRVPDNYVAQPYLDGMPASLSLLCRDGAAWLLSCNRQRVRLTDDGFHLAGLAVNACAHRRPTLAPLAAAVAAAVPGLWGYVGVDLILQGEQALMLEVNPRLTSAYAGLRAALGINPAALALALGHEEPALPAPAASGSADVDLELGRVA